MADSIGECYQGDTRSLDYSSPVGLQAPFGFSAFTQHTALNERFRAFRGCG